MDCWLPAPRSKPADCVFKRGPKEYRVQHEGFCSKIHATAAAARQLGWQEFLVWQEAQKPAAAAGGAAGQAKPRKQLVAKKRKASPDASTDGILQLELQQPLPQAAVGAQPGQKRGQQAAPAAAAAHNKRQKGNAGSPAAKPGSQLAPAGTGEGVSAGQTPSAATDAATVPHGKAHKQPRKQTQHAAAAADVDVLDAAAADQQPAMAARKKRARQAAAAAAGAHAPLPAPAAAAGARQQAQRVVRKPTAEAEADADMDVDAPGALAAAAAEPGPVPLAGRPAGAAHGRPAGQAAGAAGTKAPARGRRGPAAAAAEPAAGRTAGAQAAAKGAKRRREQQQAQSDEEGDSGEQQQQQQRGCGRKKQPQRPQQQLQGPAVGTDSYGLTGTGTDWDMQDEGRAGKGQGQAGPASLSEPSSTGLAPSSGAMQQPQQQPTSESAGSNWLPPELPAAAAAAAAGHAPAAAAAAGHAPAAAAAGAAAPAPGLGQASSLHVWYRGGKQATCEGITLNLQLRQQLGKGGFGAVHKVLVKATGDNSLAGLKLTGPLGNSLKTLVKANKTRLGGAQGAAAGHRAAAAGGRGGQSARSRAGSRGGSNGGGSGGGSIGSGGSGGGCWVPMALKVTLSFEQLSREMQDNFKQASAFDANVQQRMREEYDIMAACAASPHILDAFCMGTVWLGGSWRPCILMELSALGDAERVYITPANTLVGMGPRGVSSVVAQRIVRQAAVALKDLHSMAGSIHLDLKVNNLLVFGSKDAPQIKLIDFGCAKKRDNEPRYGPASGTKDWQAPEQMAADALDGPVAGRLDFCTDSWALGLLVLGLRKGQQPFWWLKQEGRLPSEMPDALRDSLSCASSPYALDTPRGSKLTRQELAFVTTCMASSSSSRPDVRALLDNQAYLSSRYRGG